MSQPPVQLFTYCRPGFEKETVAELTDIAAKSGDYGWAKLEANSGFVVFQTEAASNLANQLTTAVFVRDGWPVVEHVSSLPEADRIGALWPAIEAGLQQAGIDAFGDVSCEFPEGDAYRATAKFARKFANPLRQALRKAGWLTAKPNKKRPMLRLCFPDSSQAYVGFDNPKSRAPWPMGLVRLKFPAGAPSRSTLKLEEGFARLLGGDWRATLAEARTGVDLGSAPGGWTWQLVHHGMFAYAVDNGPMDEALMASGQVEHVKADGFIWRPPKPVDWLVCDMVENPARVAHLMCQWLIEGDAKQALFNLKLPMKQRYKQWGDIQEGWQKQLGHKYERATIRAHHLYHDREEITVYMRLK